MKPVLFADLDDTLFRSLSRFGGDTQGMTQVTTARNGNHSWMTPRQVMFMDWALAAMQVIPVTARSRTAFARVALPFAGLAVLSNGAVIQTADGQTDPVWQGRTAAVSRRFAGLLNAMMARLQTTFPTDLRTWIVAEDGADIYLCVKSNNTGDVIARDLDMAQSLLTDGFDLSGLALHRNANNLSLTPHEVSKAAAVRHLLATHPDLAGRILFGAGDSLTDLHFMAMADFMLVPPTSQIAQTLNPPASPPMPIGTARFGSYAADDVRFLLNVVDLPAVDLDQKERLIQSGQRHYSEMISDERRPDARYLALYDQACQTSIARITREMAGIASTLAVARHGAPRRMALCSLVRAGVPYGVILTRDLRRRGVDVTHFGVSIIRDKGIDANAMAAVLQQFVPEAVVFVDGWTGKGAIAGELDRSWRDLTGLPPCLVVLSDPCGHAQISGSHDDWLIPTGILGGVVSGLVSRSIRNDTVVGAADFDGCLLLDNLADLDRSRAFVDGVCDAMALCRDVAPVHLPDPAVTAGLRAASKACIDRIFGEFAVPSRNLIKPGIAEATRAVLRRRPERVFLRSADDPDVAALRHLCEVDRVDITIDPTLTGPYRALTLIRRNP